MQLWKNTRQANETTMHKLLLRQNRQLSKQLVNRSAFLKRLASLLKEGYTFHEGLILLMPHHHKQYDDVLRFIEKELKEGVEISSILHHLGYSKSTLLPVVISEINGRLAVALEGIAHRLETTENRRKKMQKILLYPLVLFCFMAVLLVVFRNYFLPNIQMLSASQNGETTGLVSILPIIVAKIPDIVSVSSIVVLIIVSVTLIYYRRMTPTKQILFIMKVPIIGRLISKFKTRNFASEMGSLLDSGISMQDALEILVDQDVDSLVSEMAQVLKGYVIYGEPFDQAILLTNGLRKELSVYAKHGADTGHLGKELIIYSEHLHQTLEEELTKWLSLLQPFLFTVLALCILAAYLALLLPVYDLFNAF